MPMLCKPQELCDSLNQISIKYEWSHEVGFSFMCSNSNE
jgi:hypothetical protein